MRYPPRGGRQAYPPGALPGGRGSRRSAGGLRSTQRVPWSSCTFSLVHDDLPALDDDDERRGRPSAHLAFGESRAAGGRCSAGGGVPPRAPRGVDGDCASAAATLGMIGGQYRDISGDDGDLVELHRLKTGRLFAAAVGCGLWAAGVPEAEQGLWRAFGEELGLLFQVVDDVLDGDGYAARLGDEAARRPRPTLPNAPVRASTQCRRTRRCWQSSSTCSRSERVGRNSRPHGRSRPRERDRACPSASRGRRRETARDRGGSGGPGAGHPRPESALTARSLQTAPRRPRRRHRCARTSAPALAPRGCAALTRPRGSGTRLARRRGGGRCRRGRPARGACLSSSPRPCTSPRARPRTPVARRRRGRRRRPDRDDCVGGVAALQAG